MLNRGIAVVFALVSLVASSSAQAPRDPKVLKDAEKKFQPEVKHDDFQKTTMTMQQAQMTARSDFSAKRGESIECGQVYAVGVSFAMVEGFPSGAHSFLHVTYYAKDWMFITKDEPLRLLAGDSIHTLRVSGEPTREVQDGAVDEEAYFAIAGEDLKWLAAQPQVRVRLTGDKSNCDFTLSQEALALAAMYNERVVLPLESRTASR